MNIGEDISSTLDQTKLDDLEQLYYSLIYSGKDMETMDVDCFFKILSSNIKDDIQFYRISEHINNTTDSIIEILDEIKLSIEWRINTETQMFQYDLHNMFSEQNINKCKIDDENKKKNNNIGFLGADTYRNIVLLDEGFLQISVNGKYMGKNVREHHLLDLEKKENWGEKIDGIAGRYPKLDMQKYLSIKNNKHSTKDLTSTEFAVYNSFASFDELFKVILKNEKIFVSFCSYSKTKPTFSLPSSINNKNK